MGIFLRKIKKIQVGPPFVFGFPQLTTQLPRVLALNKLYGTLET